MTPSMQLLLSTTAVLAAVLAIATTDLGAAPTVGVADALASTPSLVDATPRRDVTGTQPEVAPTTAATARPRVRVPERDAMIAAAPEPSPSPTPASSGTDGAPRVVGDTVVAGGTSTDPVDTGGRTVRWSLGVEVATGLDVDAVLAIAEAALYDERSWARDVMLVRVDDPTHASVRVLVATPATVDALCAEAGLDTVGQLSCWNGSTAAINLERWSSGTREFTDLDLYRRYVVNHEVGHALGHGHVDCGGAGELADVMQQQTKSLAGCLANAWPYPG